MKVLSHNRARRLLNIPEEDLSANQQAELANHLAGCPECQAYAADLRSLQRVLVRAMDARWDYWHPSPAASQAVQRRWKEKKMKRQTVKLIAVVVGIAAVLLLIFYGPGLLPIILCWKACPPLRPRCRLLKPIGHPLQLKRHRQA